MHLTATFGTFLVLIHSMKNSNQKHFSPGLLQKYKGSKPVLIGIPYPVVYEIHATPQTDSSTVQDYGRHGNREENSSSNLNRVCQT